MSSAPQKILRIRRDYNAWVANETLEDYALRYTPRSFRKWSEFRVANTAFGAVSFLALEAIGGTIALNYGFANALWAILAVGLVTFLTGLPISVYAARHGVDMDLLTRGAGFGYLGSTITSLVYAGFTFIFFALEAAIMALALQMVVDLPLVWCYAISAVVVIPLVTHGITLISRLQAFLLELGYGFCFVGRQHRLSVGQKEYFIDLLFYHRFIKALVAFELKVGAFEPEFAGKMDFYLNLLNDKERGEGDRPSIGIILCAEKDDVEIEYALRTKKNPIGVAVYQLQPNLPANLKGKLPTAKQLATVVRAELPEGGQA